MEKRVGSMVDPSAREAELITEFKAYLKNKGVVYSPKFDDRYLLRFLRARKLDLGKAYEMFNKFINWRHDFGTDNISVSTLPLSEFGHRYRMSDE
mmetsp:Transcript_21193/g.23991  ORF Transcript_21193/g.23991 Transcript_21193/m.23991 type:complete len:95 (-) Transcript_21193:1062-1346(-)